MLFKCDCCGYTVDVPQRADEQGIALPDVPPDGWRAIHTTIIEHDGEGGVTDHHSEVSHSCADCNSNMTVDEHLEAEHETRRRQMREDHEL